MTVKPMMINQQKKSNLRFLKVSRLECVYFKTLFKFILKMYVNLEFVCLTWVRLICFNAYERIDLVIGYININHVHVYTFINKKKENLEYKARDKIKMSKNVGGCFC